jgi:signal transduction histidine kinase
MYQPIVPLIVLGVINILLGVVVWLRDQRKLSNISFLGLAFSVGVWCIGIAGFYGAGTTEAALNWTRLYYAAPAALVSFLVLFALTFPDKPLGWRTIAYFLLPFTMFSVALLINPNFLVQSIVFVGEVQDVTLNTATYLLYCLFIVTYFLIGLGTLAYNRKRTGAHNRQISLFLVGSIIPAVLGVTFNLILPLLGNYELIWAGPLATTIFAMFVGLNIVLNKMFDIRMFVLRAMAYSVTALVLGTIYIGPLVLLSLWTLGVDFSWFTFLTMTIVGTLAAINYQRLKVRFDKLTNRIFFRDVYEADVLLARLNKSIIETIDITQLLEKTTGLLDESFHPEYCLSMIQGNKNDETFMAHRGKPPTDLDSKQLIEALQHLGGKTVHHETIPVTAKKVREYLEEINVHAVTRLTVVGANGREANGYIILGPRKSGLPYATKDLQVLDTVGNTLMIALQNALRFEEIQLFNVTLQGRVDEATRKYRVTNEKLKKLDETKDEFISMASHQLRTPLTSVKGYLSMVLEGDVGTLNKQQEELLKQSFLSSQRMVNLIADLLNLSRLNTGKFVIDAHPIDLRDVIDSELMQLRETAKAKDIELTYERPQAFPILFMDENKIHQVVMNFVDNAIYYTPSGGKIDVALRETPTAVEYTVTDTGIGVPREVQRHLFTKFYRADNAKRARPDGTGLGLFMAKKVIIAQGGSVVFESEEDKGSTFGFRFNKSQLAVPQVVAPTHVNKA